MTGKYDIILYNNKIHYHLTVRRNLTILRGDSATGKSELIRLMAMHNGSPQSSGITLICEKKCTVLNDGNWELFINTYTGRIFFIDEGNEFLRTKQFAESIRGNDNYFVIVSRESLPQLPYSIEEIYGLREGEGTGKYHKAKQIYNEMYKIYGTLPDSGRPPVTVITEDSNSGYDFFQILFPGKCISANGKSNVKRHLLAHANESVLAIVDGAAFGPEMQENMELAEAYDRSVTIFAPESFEYLILKSGLIEVPKNILEETWNYADTISYISWEDFFTKYLSNISRNEVFQYSKHKLNSFFKTVGSIEKISAILPDNIREIIKTNL